MKSIAALPRQRTKKRARNSEWKPSKERLGRLQQTLSLFPGGIPRSEYPRPRLVRGNQNQWMCLNGVWEFAFDSIDSGVFDRWQDKTLCDFILVPFAPQWDLSCKAEREVYPIAWYARDFDVPADWLSAPGQPALDRDVLLHFGACDYRTTVWINGVEAGHNVGGHVPFSLGVSSLVRAGANRVVLRVEDLQDPKQPRGKQAPSGRPSGCDYWNTTGLWQSVWLESAPGVRVQDVVLTPLLSHDAGNDALEVSAFLHAPSSRWRVEVEVFDGLLNEDEDEEKTPTPLARTEKQISGAVARLSVPLPHASRWTPDAPHLLGVRVRLWDEDGVLWDEVRSYTGLRSVALGNGQFHLNGEPLYLKMVLDQGYWREGGLTAPSDEALRADVEWTKRFGFNGARKHQKVEDPRWLYWCDRLGLLVWGEMANARAWNIEAEEKFLAEWERAVRRDLSHPCIVAWVPHNESWGLSGLENDHPAQHAFVERVVALTRRLDPTRPVISNDGWEHADVTDIVGIHDYQTGQKLRRHWAKTLKNGVLPERTWTKSKRLFVNGARHRGQPVMLTEVGGFLNVPDIPKEQWDALYTLYNTARTSDELLRKYRDLMEIIASFPFVSGFCYTQLTDVEQEINGLLTYDRKPKIAPESIAAIHRELFDAKEEMP